MHTSPVITGLRITEQGNLLVVFEGRTSITFVPANNGAHLDAVIVCCGGRQVAYCDVRRWKFKGSRGAAVFDSITAPATPELVGRYCEAAYDKLHEESKSGEPLPLQDHVRALDVVAPGYECYLAMMI